MVYSCLLFQALPLAVPILEASITRISALHWGPQTADCWEFSLIKPGPWTAQTRLLALLVSKSAGGISMRFSYSTDIQTSVYYDNTQWVVITTNVHEFSFFFERSLFGDLNFSQRFSAPNLPSAAPTLPVEDQASHHFPVPRAPDGCEAKAAAFWYVLIGCFEQYFSFDRCCETGKRIQVVSSISRSSFPGFVCSVNHANFQYKWIQMT